MPVATADNSTSCEHCGIGVQYQSIFYDTASFRLWRVCNVCVDMLRAVDRPWFVQAQRESRAKQP